MNKNKESTRYYSDLQESYIAKKFNLQRQGNSGAGLFNKGDLIDKDCSLLVECKTTISPKSSFSIKKEWIDKNKQEAFNQGLSNSCIAFNFEPNGDNYFIIDEKLFFTLKDYLEKLDI